MPGHFTRCGWCDWDVTTDRVSYAEKGTDMKTRIVAMIGLGLLCRVALAQDDKPETSADAKVVLKKADDATKAVKAVSYETTIKATGTAAQRLGSFHGKVQFTGWENGRPKMFRYEIEIAPPDGGNAKAVTIGTDGDTCYLIDHEKKTAYVDIDPQVFGSLIGAATAAPMLEFVHPTPFSDELNAKSQKLEGTESVEGETCYKVLVDYKLDGEQQSRWYFSTKDFLPRRVERLFTKQGFGQDKVVKDLKVIKSIGADVFKFKLPEGYTQTDDFAP